MRLALLAHVRGDGDLIQAWLDHYVALGVSAFHLIVHGPPDDNRELLALTGSYPILVRQTYDDPFDAREKGRRLSALLQDFRGQWILVVDSDEFLELPCGSLSETIRSLERFGATCLAAPLLQRLRSDGSLEALTAGADPSRAFPLCSVDLYRTMGSAAALAKFPLLRCEETTSLHPGNHFEPNGPGSAAAHLRGVSHHFKWRRSVLDRLHERIGARRKYWEESGAYLAYLEQNDFRLPLAGTFPYSRRELIRRSLLRAATWYSATAHYLWRRLLASRSS